MRNNNLDLLRHLLASSVVFLHLHHLADDKYLTLIANKLSLLSANAVSGFFLVSGYVIYASYLKRKSLRSYVLSRFLRLYPLYFLVIVVSAVVLYPLSNLPVKQYIENGASDYLLSNLFFLNFLAPELPNVFSANNISAVNGALWTLKIEVSFYLVLPMICCAIARYGFNKSVACLYLLSLLYTSVIDSNALNILTLYQNQLKTQLPAQLVFFLAGMACYEYKPLLAKVSLWWIPFALLILHYANWYFHPFALAIIISKLFILPTAIPTVKFSVDYSYGIYILHFPLIQVLINSGLFENRPLLLALSTWFALIALAAASWHFIEKPILKYKTI